MVCRMVALTTLALPYGRYVPSDLSVFAGWAEDLAEGVGITGDLWQYPAGVALLLGVVGSLGGGTMALVGLILAADLAVLCLLRRTRGALLWAVSPLFVGPIMLTRLETVVTLTAVAGLMTRSPLASGLWLGAGASLKLWPGALVTAVRERALLRSVAAAVALIAVTLAAALAFDAPAFVGNQTSRGLQVESVAAWPFMAARALGAPVELVYRNGSTEVVGPLADAAATLLLPLSALLVAAILIWSWRHLRPSAVGDAAAHSLVVVMALLLTSRVLSPQFIVWALGLCAVILTARAAPRPLVTCLLGSALLGQILYPHVYLDYLDGGLLGLIIQTSRLALLIGATWFSWTTACALARATAHGARAHPPLPELGATARATGGRSWPPPPRSDR